MHIYARFLNRKAISDNNYPHVHLAFFRSASPLLSRKAIKHNVIVVVSTRVSLKWKKGKLAKIRNRGRKLWNLETFVQNYTIKKLDFI